MVDLFVVKNNDGTLRAADADAFEKIRKMKPGERLKAKITRPHNAAFHRKLFALFQLAYEHFCEYGLSEVKYRGKPVVPSFDRFRKDLTILAGYYTPVFCINGETRLEADSLSYEKCDDETKEKIYSDVLNAALQHVYKFKMTEQELRYLVDQYMSFS